MNRNMQAMLGSRRSSQKRIIPLDMSEKIDQRLRVTLRQLEVFAAMAGAESTRSAAEKVARSQSAASTAIAMLESALGVRLFDRVGRRLLLNENGRALLPRAVGALEKAGEIQSLFDTAHAAPLRLASSYTVGEYLLPPLVSRWKLENPLCRIRMDIANTADVLEAVARLEVDLGFIEAPRTHPDLFIRRWLSDELTIFAAPDHPWAQQRISMYKLASARWIVREPGSGTREATDRWLVPHLAQITVEMELGSNEAVKRAVASGLGLGCLSRRVVAEAIDHGSLIALKSSLPPMRRTFSIVAHRGKPLGSAAQDFLRHCTAHVARQLLVR